MSISVFVSIFMVDALLFGLLNVGSCVVCAYVLSDCCFQLYSGSCGFSRQTAFRSDRGGEARASLSMLVVLVVSMYSMAFMDL